VGPCDATRAGPAGLAHPLQTGGAGSNPPAPESARKQLIRSAVEQAPQVGGRVGRARRSGRRCSSRVRAWSRRKGIADGNADDAAHDGHRRSPDRPSATATLATPAGDRAGHHVAVGDRPGVAVPASIGTAEFTTAAASLRRGRLHRRHWPEGLFLIHDAGAPGRSPARRPWTARRAPRQRPQGRHDDQRRVNRQRRRRRRP
jgi:hypothetical protein